MSGKFSLDDYIDVAERIVLFKEKYPNGTLQTIEWKLVDVSGKTFVVYHAAAFRDPEDARPGHGIAWEPFPGPTPYTKDSELMNAETAAWGRAIVAVGLAANRKIASRQEVRARQGSQEARQPVPPPQLSEDAAKAVSAAVRASGMPQEWVRLQLIDAGVQNVPEGQIMLSTVKALTPEQAESVISACNDVANARAKATERATA